MQGTDNYRIAQPREGSQLIAFPSLTDSHFNHSVVEIIDYVPTGETLGLVLNRTTPLTLDKAIDGIKPGLKIPVFAGGPVGADRLIFMHTLGDAFNNATAIAPGLFVGGDLDDVVNYVNAGYPIEGSIRFFVGYSGWSPGQLKSEIHTDSWIVAQPLSNSEILTLTDDNMWHTAVKRLGEEFREWQRMPMHPIFN